MRRFSRKSSLLLTGSVLTCLIFTLNGLAAPPVTYSYPPVTSRVPVPLVTALPSQNPIRMTNSRSAYAGQRQWAFADFNRDGRTDILVAASFGNNGPKLPIEIWLQQPDGTFVNRTSDVIEGPVPIGGGGNPLVADFNEDGRPDVFLMDGGLEDKFPSDGETNKLLLSQPNGRLVDASWRISPNPLAFHHTASVADIDGDGHLDVMITAIATGVPTAATGVFFLMGDGQGNFTRSESRVPSSIRFKTPAELFNHPDPQGVTAAAFADFDGDGRVDIVSIGHSDLRTGKATMRFHRQMPDGTFVEQSRRESPFENSAAWLPGIGDFNGDGLPDLAVRWENIPPAEIQLLRNDGNFQFTDITLQALGTYNPGGTDHFGMLASSAKAALTDVNRDGFADLVLSPFGVSINSLLTTSAVFLSEGDGRFSPWSLRTADGGPSADSLLSVLGCSLCDYQQYFLDFDGDGLVDLLVAEDLSNHTLPPAVLQTTAVMLHLFRGAVAAPTIMAAVLPASRSVSVGSPATAFATIINTGPDTATSCRIVPAIELPTPTAFTYQATDPATNAVIGTPNTPIDIASGKAQSFVFTLTATGVMRPDEFRLFFLCSNRAAALIAPGLNTLLFSASSTPVPDIVALAATTTNDGIVNIPGTNETGAFAVATVNVGTTGTITASADTGIASLPVNIFLCETNPATGQCISGIGQNVTTQINANATPTFGIFVQGTGNVPFDPAANRIFVRFKDGGGVTRGSTSVAVRTE
jgi:FG-GAP-like repeat